MTKLIRSLLPLKSCSALSAKLYAFGYFCATIGAFTPGEICPTVIAKLSFTGGFTAKWANYCFTLDFFLENTGLFGLFLNFLNHSACFGFGYYNIFAGSTLYQRPSSSLKSASHTHCRQPWQRWKCCWASFWALTKACSCSFCHSGLIPLNLSESISEP